MGNAGNIKAFSKCCCQVTVAVTDAVRIDCRRLDTPPPPNHATLRSAGATPVRPWKRVEIRSWPYNVAMHNQGMGILGDGIEVMKLANIAANAELYGKLATFVEKAQELQAKVETLEEANKELRQQLHFKGQFVRVAGWVYVDGDDEPMCSRCADVDNRPVHLTIHRDVKMGQIVICPQCKSQSRRYVLRSHALKEAQ